MTSVAVAGMADKLLNCNSNEYSVVRMPGKGFCGFHALSYALTGSPARYNEFPEHFAGVRILNSPVVPLTPQTTSVIAASPAAVNEFSGNGTQINDCNTTKTTATHYKCDSCEKRLST